MRFTGFHSFHHQLDHDARRILVDGFLGVELSVIQLLVTTAARIAFCCRCPVVWARWMPVWFFIWRAGLGSAVGLSAGLLIHLRNIALGGLGLWWGSRRLHLRA